MSVKMSIKRQQRMLPEERRRALLDAALAVFANGGFACATLNDVAERAGVTKGCVYHHFDSKEALLLALMRECSRSTTDILTLPPQPQSRAEAIGHLVDQLWNHFQTPGQLELTTLAIRELPNAPDIARVLFDEVVAPRRRTMRATLETIPRPPDTTPDVSSVRPHIDAVARIIPYLILGAALGQRIFDGIDSAHPSPDEVKETLTQILLQGA